MLYQVLCILPDFRLPFSLTFERWQMNLKVKLMFEWSASNSKQSEQILKSLVERYCCICYCSFCSKGHQTPKSPPPKKNNRSIDSVFVPHVIKKASEVKFSNKNFKKNLFVIYCILPDAGVKWEWGRGGGWGIGVRPMFSSVQSSVILKIIWSTSRPRCQWELKMIQTVSHNSG